MDETKVVNVNIEPYDIYIGRTQSPHHYGNPFKIGSDGTRTIVIKKCDLWLRGIAYSDIEPKRREWILKNVESLRGKTLGCHCKPKACHGDLYVEYLVELNMKGGEIPK
jgi:hypothetical protein